MKDIFDAKIICKDCDKEMKAISIEKNGFMLRAVECPKCKNKIVHPSDLEKYNHYNALRHKTFNVKLRVVGNSHAITIPNEIVEFINQINQEMNRSMNEMVKLCFEDFGRISLRFIDENEEEMKKWQ